MVRTRQTARSVRGSYTSRFHVMFQQYSSVLNLQSWANTDTDVAIDARRLAEAVERHLDTIPATLSSNDTSTDHSDKMTRLLTILETAVNVEKEQRLASTDRYNYLLGYYQNALVDALDVFDILPSEQKAPKRPPVAIPVSIPATPQSLTGLSMEAAIVLDDSDETSVKKKGRAQRTLKRLRE